MMSALRVILVLCFQFLRGFFEFGKKFLGDAYGSCGDCSFCSSAIRDRKGVNEWNLRLLIFLLCLMKLKQL